MVISDLKTHYGEQYHSAYSEIKKVMGENDFYWIQGSTYITEKSLIAVTMASSLESSVFTVAWVPTGMKTGVSTAPCASVRQAGHIPGVENIAFPDLEDNLSKISRNKTVIVHCKSGIRANMAYSILKRNGIDNVKVYLGAMDELIENN